MMPIRFEFCGFSEERILTPTLKKIGGSKIQTYILPQSGLWPRLCQSRTHFWSSYSLRGGLTLCKRKTQTGSVYINPV